MLGDSTSTPLLSSTGIRISGPVGNQKASFTAAVQEILYTLQ